jgi:hypothetical protein
VTAISIYSGLDEGFVDTTVSEGVTYNYVVFVRDDQGNWNDTYSVAINADTGIYPNTAPALITDFDASDDQPSQITLSWTNPSDPDLAEIIVLKKQGDYPTSPVDGGAVQVYQNLSPVSGGSESVVDITVTDIVTYFYAVFTRDAVGNWNATVSIGNNANAGSALDTKTPVISNIQYVPSESSVTITWDTDESATSLIEYGLNTAYGTSESSAALVTSHSIILSGLDPGTTYHYKVTSADYSGNSSASLDRTFTTINITGPATVTDFNATIDQPSQVTLSWTNPPDGDLDEVLVKRKEGEYPTSHADAGATQVFRSTYVVPSGVESFVDYFIVDETTYYYAVFTKDNVGNWNDVVWVGNNADIGVGCDMTPPVIIDVQVAVGDSISTITLETDEPTTVAVYYATASDYAVSNQYNFNYSDQILSTSHSMDISSLDPDTNYHYSLTISDDYGNAFATSDTTFTTLSDSQGGGSAGACFIATAAYGSYEDPYVRYLRDFRDKYLLTNWAGKWFVKHYYTHSPRYANWLRGHETTRAVVRILLLPFIGLAWFLTRAGLILHLTTIGLLTGVFVVFHRSRRKYFRAI